MHSIKAQDVDKLTWKPDEKPERYDYSGNRVADVEQAKLVYEIHVASESIALFEGGIHGL